MFRSKKHGAQLYNRLVLNRMSGTSSVSKHSAETSSQTIPSDAPSQEKSLIPEYLRYKAKSSYWDRFQGDRAPMVPAILMLVGVHVYAAWYLFGGEFESDFEDEKVTVLTDLVENTKRRFDSFTMMTGLRGGDEAVHELEEEKNLNTV